MTAIYQEGKYQIDCSSALWSTNEINSCYHSAGVKLKDVDWIIEDDDYIYLVEYKNALANNTKESKEFDPNEDKKRDAVVQKFYDSLHYLYLKGKSKKRKYIYVVEAIGLDLTMRKKLKKNLRSNLPFKLQENVSNSVKLIEDLDVLSIDDWNKDDVYGKYPISQVSCSDT